MSVSCSEKRPSGVLYLQVGSGQDLGESKDTLAKDDGGASGWEIVETVSVEVVSIDSSGIKSIGIESVGGESVPVKDVGVRAVGVEAFGVEAAGVEAAGVEAAGVEAVEVALVGDLDTGFEGAIVDAGDVETFAVEGSVGMVYFNYLIIKVYW